MRDVATEIRAWSAAGEKIALATVVDTWGSSPRPLGSKLAVSQSGAMAGSVSNGCVEGAVYQEAQEVLRSGQPKLLEYGVSDDVAFEVGLACGGHLEVFLQPLASEHLEVLDAVEREQPVTLLTNLDSGETKLVRGVEQEVARRHDGWFIEPYGRPHHLIVVGAIHIAIPLHRLAKLLGYRVTIVDARSKFATRERFPEADDVIVAWPDDALGRLTLDVSSHVVVLTHDPKFDLPALAAALHSDAGYIGAIGSRKTNRERFAQLREQRFSDQDLARIHGPIGLDLGGRSAEETALAILAEITAVRYGASGGGLQQVKELSASR
jgi:xanthine dehydrogenase accessory factor